MARFLLNSLILLTASLCIIAQDDIDFVVQTPAPSTDCILPGPCSVRPRTYYTISSFNGGNLASTHPIRVGLSTWARAIHVVPSGGDYEKWFFKKIVLAKSGVVAYAIVNKATRLALTVENATLFEDAYLDLHPYEADRHQLFYPTPATTEHCLILALHSGKFLTNDGVPLSTGPPSLIRQRATGMTANSLWRLNDLPCEPHPSQTYRIIHRLSRNVLGVPEAKATDRLPIKLIAGFEKDKHVRVTFRAAEANGSIYHYIQLQHSGSIFDIYNRRQQKGVQLIQYNSDRQDFEHHQQFQLLQASDRWCYIKARHSGRYLAPEIAPDRSYKTGARILQLDKTPITGGQFLFEPIGFIPEENMPYRLRNRYTGKFLEVSLGTAEEHSPLALNSLDSDANHQLWFFKEVRRHIGHYQIQAKHSKLFINANITDDEDTPLVQRGATLGIADHFFLEEVKEISQYGTAHYYRIVSGLRKPKAIQPRRFLGDDCVYAVLGGVGNRTIPKAQHWEILGG